MKREDIFHIFAVFFILLFISCGGGGGSETPAINDENSGTIPTDTDDDTGEDSSDGTADSGLIPVPETTPIPLSDQDAPVITGNIWSWQMGSGGHLYLVDDAKLFQDDENIFAETSTGTVSVSPNGQYVAFRGNTSLDVTVRNLGNDLIGTGTHTNVLQYAWSLDSSKLFWGADEQVVCMQIPSGTTSVVYQGLSETVIRSVAISRDGQYIAWAEYENDYLISMLYAQLNVDGTIGPPSVLWNGVSASTSKNKQVYAQFLDNERFVFFLKQSDGGNNSNNSVFLADIGSGSVQEVFSRSTLNNPVVSNTGSYIVFSVMSNIRILSTETWEDKLFDSFASGSPVQSLVWSPGGEFLLAAVDEWPTSLYLYSLNDLGSKWMLTKIEGTCWEIQWE